MKRKTYVVLLALLLPCAIAAPSAPDESSLHDLGEERGSNVYRSSDEGKTLKRIGQVRIPGTRVDEHMIVQRGDGSLLMLLRNTGGIARSVSGDGGEESDDRAELPRRAQPATDDVV
jgi:hypothetical protein